MSFDSLERSNHDSIEVQFYQFTRGARNWYYCNADQDVVMNGVQWSANPSSHDDINLSGESIVDTVSLTVPNTFEPAQQFRGQSPADAVYLRIFACHAVSLYPMLVMDSDFAVRWIGTVSDVQQKGADRLTIVGSTLTSAFDREGVRLTWNRNCSYAVYDPDTCRVNKAAFATNVTISALTGNSITSADIASKPDGWFDQGFIEITVADGVTQRIAIELQVGNTFTLLGTTENLLIGEQIVAYPGCAQTADMCVNKFNNILNFSGYEGMSGTSPFNGNPVF
jgi:uncharacterized phage protein (TIGR02218 family)